MATQNISFEELNIKASFEGWLKSKEESFINKKSTQRLFEAFCTDILKGYFDEISDTIFEVEKSKEKVITE